MEFGVGDRFRAGTAAGQYRCLMPDCKGLLRVKAGRIYGHRWAHVVAPMPAHEPESVWHINAKTAIAEFARAQHPNATIYLDERYTPASNKPDV
jgi:competence CoiA-like predicted nuclease